MLQRLLCANPGVCATCMEPMIVPHHLVVDPLLGKRYSREQLVCVHQLLCSRGPLKIEAEAPGNLSPILDITLSCPVTSVSLFISLFV